MKRIGKGYFYNVYDLGNGRVLKKQKTSFALFWHIMVINGFLPHAVGEYRRAIRTLPQIKQVYSELMQNVSNTQLLGNPLFNTGIEYEQDKALVLYDALRKAPLEEQYLLVEKYITLIKELWKYGCHETVYNFTINNAVNKDGEVILIDFNEMTFDKTVVEQDIEKKEWLHRWSYTQ